MKWWIRVLCTQARDLTTSIAFMIHNEPIFCLNCPNIWQRIVSKSRIARKKCTNFVLQSLQHEYFGGIPGFYLSLADASIKNCLVNIYGPKGLKAYMNSFKIAYGGKGAVWNTHEFNHITELLKKGEETKGKSTITLGKKLKIIPIQMEKNDKCLSYIVETFKQNSRFKGELAKELKLSVAEIKELVAGRSITLDDGRVITSKYMHEEAIIPPISIFINAKSMENVQFLIANMRITDYFKGKSSARRVTLIYHTVSLEVLNTPFYLDFFENFDKSVLHIIDCRELVEDETPRPAAYYFTKTLHACNSRIFPAHLTEKLNNIVNKETILNEFAKRGLKATITLMGRDFSLLPEEKTEETSVFKYQIKKDDLEECEIVKNKIENTPELKELWTKCEDIKSTRKFENEPYFVFLGTAAKQPSKRRSSSAIYINVTGNSKETSGYHNKNSYGILADCGEGTYGQMIDHFGEHLDNVLRNLRVIFITHHHGDHTFGLGQLIGEIEKSFLKIYKPEDAIKLEQQAPLYIIVPSHMLTYMELTLKLESPYFRSRVKLISSFNLNPYGEYYYNKSKIVPLIPQDKAEALVTNLYSTGSPRLKEFWKYLKEVMGIHKLHSFETNHVIDSHGLILSGPDWKVIYTGDTTPITMLENFGVGTDLLIHECTFVDNMPRKEEDIKHTNQNEVIQVVRKVKPWRALLTHFSNKDKKIANLSTEAINEKIFAAYDHLQFSLSDMEWMHMLVPLFEKVLTNEKKL